MYPKSYIRRTGFTQDEEALTEADIKTIGDLRRFLNTEKIDLYTLEELINKYDEIYNNLRIKIHSLKKSYLEADDTKKPEIYRRALQLLEDAEGKNIITEQEKFEDLSGFFEDLSEFIDNQMQLLSNIFEKASETEKTSIVMDALKLLNYAGFSEEQKSKYTKQYFNPKTTTPDTQLTPDNNIEDQR